MFVLPVGHERDELRRWPVVSIAIAGICLLVYLGLLMVEKRAEARALDAARAVFAYAADKPWLVIDEDLLFGETAALQEGSSTALPWELFEQEQPAEQVRQQQAELDRLTALWRRASEEVPMRALGLVPARLELTDLVTHVFVHAGLLHLVGNLFFFWLLGPPLEDVWGRPLFALFFLAAGAFAGLLWVMRYPSSEETVVGASGAVAALMGAFMVRFWRTRIRFVGFLWVTLKIYAGAFKAPAWIMLGLWFLRELAFSSLFEPHSTPGGGVATWAHIYGFGFGVLGALAIRGLRIEERYVRPRVVAATGELADTLLDEASRLLEARRDEEAWRLLESRAGDTPESWDAVLTWWDLACRLGRERRVAPHLQTLIQRELASGQTGLAWQHWQELRERLPELEPPAALKVRLAEALQEELREPEAVAELLASARAQLGAAPSSALMARLARASARAGLPGAAALCRRLADDDQLPDAVRAELRAAAANAAPPAPGAHPALDEGGNR